MKFTSKTFRTGFVALLSLGFGFVAPSANAIVVDLNFTELASEGGVHFDGFQNGGLVSSATVASEAFHLSSPAIPTGYPADATINHIGISGQGGDRLFVLLEADGSISDYVWVHILNGDFTVVDFLSDTDGQALQLPSTPLAVVVENGTLQFVGSYTSDQGDLVNIRVLSDVPEPASLALLGLGLAGLGWSKRKKA